LRWMECDISQAQLLLEKSLAVGRELGVLDALVDVLASTCGGCRWAGRLCTCMDIARGKSGGRTRTQRHVDAFPMQLRDFLLMPIALGH
jgi:hypothetical protein